MGKAFCCQGMTIDGICMQFGALDFNARSVQYQITEVLKGRVPSAFDEESLSLPIFPTPAIQPPACILRSAAILVVSAPMRELMQSPHFPCKIYQDFSLGLTSHPLGNHCTTNPGPPLPKVKPDLGFPGESVAGLATHEKQLRPRHDSTIL